ncbi:MAG: quaternary amine ABC transporter ATP-binding protein [Gammaproteobacteria bacterium WSBS_2016_MAG_OTU1]
MPESSLSDKNAPIIACRNIWKVYGENPEAFIKSGVNINNAAEAQKMGYITAVRDVSLEVHAGEILVVMGLSGSGKSTLVRCLSRLIEPTKGEVLFEGSDLLKASVAELTELRRHRMGMVFQNFALLPHRTVMQNVAFPLEVQKIARKEREQTAADMLELVGLSGRENYYPRELSGGQQQRVGIARSLAVKPDLWFLDEPFSALDPLIRREMQNEFLRLQAMLHKSIVFITHDFDEAIRLADRIAIMYEGGVDQVGAPEEIVLNPSTDYVREFVKDIARDKIITVGGIMEPLDGSKMADGAVASSATLAAVAREILNTDLPLPVTDKDGNVIGLVRRQKALAVLFEAPASS